MADSSFQSVNGLPVNYQQLMMNNQNIVVSQTPPLTMDGNVFDNLTSGLGTDTLSSNIDQGYLPIDTTASTLYNPAGNLLDINTNGSISSSSQNPISGISIPPGDLIGMGGDVTIKSAFESPTQYTPSGNDTGSLYGNIASGNLEAILSTGPTGVSIATGAEGANGPSGVDISLPATGPTGIDPDLFLIKAGPTKMSQEQKDRVNKKIVELQNKIAKCINVTNGVTGRLNNLNPLLLTLGMEAAEWQKKPVRQKIISPIVDKNPDGGPKPITGYNNVFLASGIGPNDFAAIHDDMLATQTNDPVAGKNSYGNCAEQASFMMAEMLKLIKDDPDFAGVKVQQVWVYKNGQDKTLSQSNHSFIQVEFPGGESTIYDPWYVNQSGLMGVDTIKKFYPKRPNSDVGWDKDKDVIVVTNQYP